jgi:HAD superfamily hydrolase (TIGR01484 family)
MTKGYLALDIDGTLSDKSHGIPDEVAIYLTERAKEGWEIVLITGRIFSFAMHSLDKFQFPYFLAVQNGADILSMPTKKVVSRSYFPHNQVADFHRLCLEEKIPFVVYAGYEEGDFCYYDESLFDEKFSHYLDRLRVLVTEEWQAVKNFDSLDQKAFPLIKAFGDADTLLALEAKFLLEHSLQASVIVDPVDPSQSMLLLTAADVNKGFAMQRIKELLPLDGPLIAAGDDNNDVPLLEIADYRIGVGNVPKAVRDIAHHITPPSTEMGIIEGLNRAIEKYS